MAFTLLVFFYFPSKLNCSVPHWLRLLLVAMEPLVCPPMLELRKFSSGFSAPFRSPRVW